MNYPALQLLIRGYFDLDWVDDYAEPADVVEHYLMVEPRSARLIVEIDDILSTYLSDEEVYNLVVVEMKSGYIPEGEGRRSREWLQQVRAAAIARWNP